MPVPSPPTPDARLPKSRAPLTPPMAICGATAAVCRDARRGSVRRAEVRLRAPRAQGGLSALQARLRALDARHGQAGRRHESLDAAERSQKDSNLRAQRGARVSRAPAGLARAGGVGGAAPTFMRIEVTAQLWRRISPVSHDPQNEVSSTPRGAPARLLPRRRHVGGRLAGCRPRPRRCPCRALASC